MLKNELRYIKNFKSLLQQKLTGIRQPPGSGWGHSAARSQGRGSYRKSLQTRQGNYWLPVAFSSVIGWTSSLISITSSAYSLDFGLFTEPHGEGLVNSFNTMQPHSTQSPRCTPEHTASCIAGRDPENMLLCLKKKKQIEGWSETKAGTIFPSALVLVTSPISS